MNSTDSSLRHFSIIDKFIIESDRVLRTLNKNAHLSAKASPAEEIPEAILNTEERKHASGLMRINHTGEVCAQALYQGQALTAKLPDVRQEMELAAQEEIDHLHWCNERLKELNSSPSMLNPFFYGASFSIGALAGAVSDKISLGFVAATEELVCRHLESHLEQLPEDDKKSKAVLEQMLEDEARHRQTALDAGGSDFPAPVKLGMKFLSKVMTKTTYRI